MTQDVSSEPDFDVSMDDPEVKKATKMEVNATKVKETSLLSGLLELTSNWYRLKRIVATILCWRFKKKQVDVDLMCKSQTAILKNLFNMTNSKNFFRKSLENSIPSSIKIMV